MYTSSVPIRKCVYGSDFEAVIDHLLKCFKVHELYFCRPGDDCLVVHPKQNIAFKVNDPLEFFRDKERKNRGIIPLGTYLVTEHSTDLACHRITLQKINSEEKLICLCWKDGPGIDWRGISRFF